jgi:hypothetical protein
LLSPEVAGQLGKNTIFNNTHPPTVKNLHYEFDGWLGDDILESFPCFICSERLMLYLKNSGLTGFEFRECEITQSDQFIDLYPDLELPKFYWFVVNNNSDSDFFLLSNASLIVSGNGLAALKKFQISHCDIENFFR